LVSFTPNWIFSATETIAVPAGRCGHDELDTLHAGVDHAIHGVAAAATYADNLDLGRGTRVFVE